MLFLFPIGPLFILFCIFLLSFLLFAIAAHDKALETRKINSVNLTANSLGLSYVSFAICIEALSRAHSIRLLTNDARCVAVQQNINAILKLLFNNYCLTESPLEDHKALCSQRLKDQGKPDTGIVNALTEKFIDYSEVLKSLFIIRITRDSHRNVQRLEHYPVKVELSSPGVLYSRMITNGINLIYILHLFPLIISSYEANFKIRAPDSPVLTKGLNDLLKEFIWKRCLEKNEKIEHLYSLTMKHLTKTFFKKNLNAQVLTIRQGQNGCLFVHVVGKPCTVYEKSIFHGMGYSKNHIKYIEQCKLPICPASTNELFQDNLCYCIYKYNPDKDNKINTNNSKECEQETTHSLLKTAIPLMNTPKGTILSIYLVFPKKHLINLFKRRQKIDYIKTKDIYKCQSSEDVSFFSSTISDRELYIFMNHFANYLYTEINKDLREIKNE